MFEWLRRRRAAPSGWKPYASIRGVTVFVPPDWEAEEHDGFATLAAPDDQVAIGVVVAMRPKSTLQQFAASCFSIEPFMRQVGREFRVRGSGWAEGLGRDFSGTYPDELEPSFRRIICIRNRDLFVKLSFYCDSEWVRSTRYQQVIQSAVVRPVGFGPA